MTVRRLIRIINDHKVKVDFYNKEDLCNPERLQNPFFLLVLSEKEKASYNKCKNKSTFVSTTPSINIPDISVRELVNILECDGTGLLEYTQKKVNSFFTEYISNDIVIATFIFLHEVGHWFQFAGMSNKVEAYIMWDYKQKQDISKKTKKIHPHITQKDNGDFKLSLTEKEKFLLKQISSEYRNIPKEKEADEYALKHLEETLSNHKDELIKYSK